MGGSLIFSAVLAWIVTAVVVKHAKQLGVIDDPALHPLPKVVHKHPTPRGGGIPIVITLVISSLLFMPLSRQTLGVLMAVGILALVGWWDDRYPEGISPYLRLGLNVLVSLFIIGSGIGVTYITNPWGGVIHLNWLLASLFALVWLVGMQNIVGWSSGVDGQLPGFVVIGALTMGLLGSRLGIDQSQVPVMILAGITAGAYLGFLPWNWYPQKIMPGYGGKSLAGLLLGVLAILSSAKVGSLLIVLGLPFVDAILVVLKRLKEKRSPFQGGYEHFHHYLLNLGWGARRISLFYWSLSAFLAILALRLNSQSKYFTMAGVILVIGGIILWLHYWSTFSKQPGRVNGSKT